MAHCMTAVMSGCSPPTTALGFFVTDNGEQITPGWPVNVGFSNYTQIFTDPDIRGPFMQIFVWTFVFAALTVVFTLAVGFVLASLLQWGSAEGESCLPDAADPALCGACVYFYFDF